MPSLLHPRSDRGNRLITTEFLLIVALFRAAASPQPIIGLDEPLKIMLPTFGVWYLQAVAPLKARVLVALHLL